jgi:hypothetical protein
VSWNIDTYISYYSATDTERLDIDKTMADEYILKEESVLELDRVIEKFSKELEESFGHFYIKGLMKKISEPESKTIKNLRENLDGMNAKIECFQRDLLQVFFKNV